MAALFDDLIPLPQTQPSGRGMFDDLVPKSFLNRVKDAVYVPPGKREAMPSFGSLLSSTPGAMWNEMGNAASQFGSNLLKPQAYAGPVPVQSALDLANLLFSPISSAATNMLGRPIESATGIRKEIPGMLATAAIPFGTVGEAASAARMVPKMEKGAQFVQDIAAKSGADISALSPSSKPLTAAEALGPNAQTQLMALGRREGETGAALAPAMAERAAGRSDRILEDMAQSVGIHPEAAKGNIDALVQAGQAQAKPLFDAALSQPGPVWNADLARLAQRPAIQKATRLAIEDLKNADINPVTHGLSDEVSAVQYARSAPPEENGIFATIRKMGGLATKDAKGNLTPEGQEITNILKDVRYPGLVNNQGGANADYVREALTESGWFPASDGHIRDLYDAMAQEAGGSKFYHPDSSIFGELQNRAAFDSEFAQAGIKASDSQAEAAQKLAALRGTPNSPASQMQPTAQAWDLIRKNLNGTIERDAFGKPIPDSISRGNYNINQASRDLTGALKTAIPGYSDALAKSGDYLSARAAFEQGQKAILNANVTAQDFAKVVGRMSPAEVEALKGGVANKIFDMAQNGRLRPAQFLTDKAQAKLAVALGPDQARAFVQNLEQEASMAAFERRAAPAAGSQTTPLGQAMKEQDAFGGSQLGEHAANMLTKGPKGAALDYLSSRWQDIADRLKTSGLSVEDRNLAGLLLMLRPEQLHGAINALQLRAPTPISFPRRPALPLLLQAPQQQQQ